VNYGRVLNLVHDTHGTLDLADDEAIDHDPRLNLGDDIAEVTKIAAGGTDGEEVAGWRYTNSEMLLPIHFHPQESWDDLVDLYTSVREIIVDPPYVVQFGALDATVLWEYDVVEPADVPALIAGTSDSPPDKLLYSAAPLNIVVRRLPGLPREVAIGS
jgi:hypothetical protein